MVTLHKGDKGVRITITLKDSNGNVQDISYAATRRFKFKKPGGETISVDANFVSDGSDGKLYYDTQEELNESGQWLLQVHTAGTGFSIHSNVQQFEVLANLEA